MQISKKGAIADQKKNLGRRVLLKSTSQGLRPWCIQTHAHFFCISPAAHLDLVAGVQEATSCVGLLSLGYQNLIERLSIDNLTGTRSSCMPVEGIALQFAVTFDIGGDIVHMRRDFEGCQLDVNTQSQLS